jgi:hypothetical protein
MKENYTDLTRILVLLLAASLVIAVAACSSPKPLDEQDLPQTGEKGVLRSPEDTPAPQSTQAPVTSTEETQETSGQAIQTEEPQVTEEPIIQTEEPQVTEEPILRTEEPQTGSRPSGMSRAYPVIEGEDACRWETTLEDKFEGDRLDTSKWETGYKAGTKEAQYYVHDAFEFEDGILKIRAEERQVRDREYASGILTTRYSFDQKYGRFEVRAKMPAGQGLWPAFWLLPTSQNYPLEIDVFEFLGHQTDTVYMTNHWRGKDGRSTFQTYGFKGPDFTQDFHVFEIRWNEEEIVWYIDWVERARETRGIPHEPMFLLLNLAVGGEWPGYPDDTTPFPSYLEVDYVRVYEWVCPGEAN